VAEFSMQEARAVAAEAFVFGYPLVLMDVSRAVFMNSQGSDGRRSRANELEHRREFPDASFTAVVSPNADTLYSTAWLDLAGEPVVLGVPSSGGRYYLLPLLSGWTDVFASPGTRTTGDGEGAFAVVGPDWDGELPRGLREIRSPTSMVWLIGRTQTNGKRDYESVQRFQDGLSLMPLSAWGREPAQLPEAPVDPGVDVETPPPDQVEAMDARAFFGRLAKLMVDNPPAEADAPALARFAAIGLSVGSFQPTPELAAALDQGVKAGIAGVRAALGRPASLTDGWSTHRDLGSYGTDYFKRAFVALVGLGANLGADAIYPHASVDRGGEALNGIHRYVVRFGPGQTPPARAFWSLTMYNEHHYFVHNPLDRYAIGDRDPLTRGDDGSLDLWLQHESPGRQLESNWLPAPSGRFNVILRIYWPGREALDGTWTPPGIERLR
jgi:hypothetical protein